jgi:diguanylate cyclase (GGDEF)-like protein
MLDLDGFKYYNDTFGHRVGDKTLKIIAEAIVQSVRTIDIVARYGGDEFMVILPETDKALAINIAERLRNDVAKTLLPTRNTTGLPRHRVLPRSRRDHGAAYRPRGQGPLCR